MRREKTQTGGRRERQHLRGCDGPTTCSSMLFNQLLEQHTVSPHTNGTDQVGLQQGNGHPLNANSARHCPFNPPEPPPWPVVENSTEHVFSGPLLVTAPRFILISSGDDHDGLLHACSRRCVSYAGFHFATFLGSRRYAFAHEAPQSCGVLDVCSR